MGKNKPIARISPNMYTLIIEVQAKKSVELGRPISFSEASDFAAKELTAKKKGDLFHL